ncbi:3-isopropylmalate dehydratase large subunit [Striga asiatica]|uniref:3-isopropylmalate dehydratase large subunit n=1 Tax=Striga asiatica TaxID=4170 RepID=A0A5A7NXU4_STRAF|nr:3-isopropylmalate dehydratase large subunit [Striga asiatica]
MKQRNAATRRDENGGPAAAVVVCESMPSRPTAGLDGGGRWLLSVRGGGSRWWTVLGGRNGPGRQRLSCSSVWCASVAGCYRRAPQRHLLGPPTTAIYPAPRSRRNPPLILRMYMASLNKSRSTDSSAPSTSAANDRRQSAVRCHLVKPPGKMAVVQCPVTE